MKISVITVCKNAQSTIARTLDSVALQDWPDIEHIIIDGGSSDRTVELVQQHHHAKMHLVSEPDNGLYDAMNKGLALATGRYVGFLNADDLYARNDAIRLIADAAEASTVDCIMGNVQFFDGDLNVLVGRLYSVVGFKLWWVKLGIMPPHPGLFVRRELLLDIGGFDLSYKKASDFDLVARLFIGRQASWKKINKTITLFCTGGISTSGGLLDIDLTREFARSLSALAVPYAGLRVLLRYPIKSLQYLPSSIKKILWFR